MRPFASALLTYCKARVQSHAGVTITNLSGSRQLRLAGHLMEHLQTHRVILRPFTAADAAEGRRLFDALSAGGETVMPFAATFWSPGFGMARDRFGIPWMVNVVHG